MGCFYRCDYWISYVHYPQCDWVDTRLVIRYSNRSKGQCTNPLIRFDLIRWLAVGLVRRYRLQSLLGSSPSAFSNTKLMKLILKYQSGLRTGGFQSWCSTNAAIGARCESLNSIIRSASQVNHSNRVASKRSRSP